MQQLFAFCSFNYHYFAAKIISCRDHVTTFGNNSRSLQLSVPDYGLCCGEVQVHQELLPGIILEDQGKPSISRIFVVVQFKYRWHMRRGGARLSFSGKECGSLRRWLSRPCVSNARLYASPSLINQAEVSKVKRLDRKISERQNCRTLQQLECSSARASPRTSGDLCHLTQ